MHQICNSVSLSFVFWSFISSATKQSNSIYDFIHLHSFSLLPPATPPFHSLCVPDQGTVQKVVVLPNNSTSSGELILEELEVFQVCSQTFILSPFVHGDPTELSKVEMSLMNDDNRSTITVFMVGLEFSSQEKRSLHRFQLHLNCLFFLCCHPGLRDSDNCSFFPCCSSCQKQILSVVSWLPSLAVERQILLRFDYLIEVFWR